MGGSPAAAVGTGLLATTVVGAVFGGIPLRMVPIIVGILVSLALGVLGPRLLRLALRRR